MTPEQQARVVIDRLLASAGWIVQKASAIGTLVRSYREDSPLGQAYQ